MDRASQLYARIAQLETQLQHANADQAAANNANQYLLRLFAATQSGPPLTNMSPVNDRSRLGVDLRNSQERQQIDLQSEIEDREEEPRRLASEIGDEGNRAILAELADHKEYVLRDRAKHHKALLDQQRLEGSSARARALAFRLWQQAWEVSEPATGPEVSTEELMDLHDDEATSPELDSRHDSQVNASTSSSVSDTAKGDCTTSDADAVQTARHASVDYEAEDALEWEAPKNVVPPRETAGPHVPKNVEPAKELAVTRIPMQPEFMVLRDIVDAVSRAPAHSSAEVDLLAIRSIAELAVQMEQQVTLGRPRPTQLYYMRIIRDIAVAAWGLNVVNAASAANAPGPGTSMGDSVPEMSNTSSPSPMDRQDSSNANDVVLAPLYYDDGTSRTPRVPAFNPSAHTVTQSASQMHAPDPAPSRFSNQQKNGNQRAEVPLFWRHGLFFNPFFPSDAELEAASSITTVLNHQNVNNIASKPLQDQAPGWARPLSPTKRAPSPDLLPPPMSSREYFTAPSEYHRTVIVSHLPNSITAKDLTCRVRGGMVVKITMMDLTGFMPRLNQYGIPLDSSMDKEPIVKCGMSAMIIFLEGDAAQAWVDFVTQRPQVLEFPDGEDELITVFMESPTETLSTDERPEATSDQVVEEEDRGELVDIYLDDGTAMNDPQTPTLTESGMQESLSGNTVLATATLVPTPTYPMSDSLKRLIQEGHTRVIEIQRCPGHVTIQQLSDILKPDYFKSTGIEDITMTASEADVTAEPEPAEPEPTEEENKTHMNQQLEAYIQQLRDMQEQCDAQVQQVIDMQKQCDAYVDPLKNILTLDSDVALNMIKDLKKKLAEEMSDHAKRAEVEDEEQIEPGNHDDPHGPKVRDFAEEIKKIMEKERRLIT